MNQNEAVSPKTIEWLLKSDYPDVRHLAMRDLLQLPADSIELIEARRAAHQEGNIAKILSHMNVDGFWVKPGPGYGPKYKSTVWAITMLAQLGASVKEDARIEQACNYLLDHALTDGGRFAYNGLPSGTFDCLQGNLLWSVIELGCQDPRLDTAIDWTARSVIGEGIAPRTEKRVTERYYQYNSGPGFPCGANEHKQCAWGAIKVLLALSCVPANKRSLQVEQAIQYGVNFLLSVNPISADYPRQEGNNPNLSWWRFGFPVFYVTDILQIAETMTRLGLGQDPRLHDTRDFILSKRDQEGCWKMEHPYASKTWGNFGKSGQPNPWVTVRALRVLKSML